MPGPLIIEHSVGGGGGGGTGGGVEEGNRVSHSFSSELSSQSM